MTKTEPLDNYEDLIRAIHDRYDGMSRAYQRIAVFLTQNPNDVAVKSVNALADQCEIHASSFVRFAQSLGFKGFKELQGVFQKRLSTAAPGFEARIRAINDELGDDAAAGGYDRLRQLVIRDIASLEELLSDTAGTELERAADMMLKADTIYLMGQLRSEPVVGLMRYILTMLGKRVVLLDASGGLATHMARTIGKRDMLFVVSFRFYAIETVNVAEEAAAAGIPVVAITDSTLSPVAKCADILFSVPEREYAFCRSLAAPMCLAQALTLVIAARQQGSAQPRIPTVTRE